MDINSLKKNEIKYSNKKIINKRAPIETTNLQIEAMFAEFATYMLTQCTIKWNHWNISCLYSSGLCLNLWKIICFVVSSQKTLRWLYACLVYIVNMWVWERKKKNSLTSDNNRITDNKIQLVERPVWYMSIKLLLSATISTFHQLMAMYYSPQMHIHIFK